ncbi:unnamed protein product, partial [Symbiodinium pilosum]
PLLQTPKARTGVMTLRQRMWNCIAVPSVVIVGIAACAAFHEETATMIQQLELMSTQAHDQEAEDDQMESNSVHFRLQWDDSANAILSGKKVNVHRFVAGGRAWKVVIWLRDGGEVGFYVTRQGHRAQMPFTIEIKKCFESTALEVLAKESFGDWGSIAVDGKGPVIPLAMLRDVEALDITITRDGPLRRAKLPWLDAE